MKIKGLFKFGGDSNFGKLTPVISAIGILILIFLWWLEARLEIIPTKILPGPFDVIGSLGRLVGENHLFGNIWFSVKMNLSAYVWAILISLPLGIIVTVFPALNLAIGRYISAIRFLPLPACVAIFIAISGLTYTTKLSFLVVALIIYIVPEVDNRVANLQNPSNDKDFVYLQTMRTMGASNFQIFRYVYWPYITSGVSGSIRSLLALSWSYVTISELIYKDGTINGIGALINTSIRQSDMAAAWACLFIVILIGVIQDILFKEGEKLLFPHMYNRKRLFE